MTSKYISSVEGSFYQSLALSSGCIYWCMNYQLSDPFDDDFVSLFFCHYHTRIDAMLTKRDGLFSKIVGDAYKKLSEASILFQS